METKENNQEELLDKKELLSDEELQDVAAGRLFPPAGGTSACISDCIKKQRRPEAECRRACGEA